MKKSVFIFFAVCAVAILSEDAAGHGATRNIGQQRVGSDNPQPVSSIINFSDSFDMYTAGTQLVVQNGIDWGTWSGLPGSGEDPFVSSTYAYNGSNSVVIVSANDLVKPYGSLTTGMWKISWQQYIPAGKAGYFNTMSGFTPNPFYWVMEAYFDAGGAGRLLTGDPQVDFTWTEDIWHLVEVIVDLDSDTGQFLIDGTLIHTWTWTLGASGGTGPLRLDVTDFYGATAGDEMYVDDFEVIPLACADFTSFLTRCTASGMVQARAVLRDNISHSGETVLFQIDEDIYPATIGDNGTSSRASISITGLGAGDHTVSIIDPAECFSAIVVTCLMAKESANQEWEADDARWAAEAAQTNAQVAPSATKLLGNHPNPFNPVTTISYQLPTDAHVTLTVSDVIGREVARLVDGPQAAGYKSVLFDGSKLASGIYFYRLQAGNFVESRKLILMK